MCMEVREENVLLCGALTIIQYSKALYNSITSSAHAFACSLTVGASDAFITFITGLSHLHLGEVL